MVAPQKSCTRSTPQARVQRMACPDTPLIDYSHSRPVKASRTAQRQAGKAAPVTWRQVMCARVAPARLAQLSAAQRRQRKEARH
jgi:hypothetical protein